MFQIEEDGVTLQRLVSEKAYLVIESYHKFNEASELISMLGAIAKKPLSLTELIQKSDLAIIIKMINKKDNDQVAWFRALFTTQVFKNKEALDCINRWAHLCGEDEVTLLLNLSVQTNKENFHKLIIKCASCLDVEKLLLVCTRHFYRNKFSHVLNANIGPSLTLIFNKLTENQFLLDDLAKEVILLLLQNPMLVFTYINNECVRNKFYTDCLIDTFDKIKEISKIDSVGIVSMKEVLNKNISNSQNEANFAYLLKELYNIEYFTNEEIVLKILLPSMKQCYDERRLEELINVMQIFMVSIFLVLTIIIFVILHSGILRTMLRDKTHEYSRVCKFLLVYLFQCVKNFFNYSEYIHRLNKKHNISHFCLLPISFHTIYYQPENM